MHYGAVFFMIALSLQLQVQLYAKKNGKRLMRLQTLSRITATTPTIRKSLLQFLIKRHTLWILQIVVICSSLFHFRSFHCFAFVIPSLSTYKTTISDIYCRTETMGDHLIPTQQETSINDPSSFVIKYLQRLHLNPIELVQNPTIENLHKIQEAHLQYIAFENLSQHGCAHPATVTDMNAVSEKILDQKRGGFCFEVNGLLGELLIELGYIVCRVPAHVYIENKMFRDVQSHMILIVSCPQDTSTSTSTSLWMVDVGFGEPAIHPLRYDTFDEIQLTPDGMQSKIGRANDGGDDVILYWWYSPLNQWVPRLKWKYYDSMLGVNGPSQSSFDPFLENVLEESSIFAQKLICCRLTRDQKLTVAGNLFKVTGPPRYVVEKANANKEIDNGTDSTARVQSQTSPPVDARRIESGDEIRQILQDHFGIPIESTKGITLAKSLRADPNIWSNQ